MRKRERILRDLEAVYREAFQRAEERGDQEGMARLDFDFQRDQLLLEAVLDVRDGLVEAGGEEEDDESLLDKARALRDLTRRRP